MSLHRRYGFRLWVDIPVSLKPHLEREFDVRFYGFGFWMFPLIPGLMIWKRRQQQPEQGDGG